MDFKAKMNSFVKTVGDKTSETIEVTKLKTKINQEKGKIKDNYIEIGRALYKKYKETGEADSEYLCHFQAIDASKEAIGIYEDNIKKVKYED